MDLVDSNLKAMDVISVFGPYAKFLVEEVGEKCTSMAGEHYTCECMKAALILNEIMSLQALPTH